jgi:ribosome-associated toxin RatA of RatAB toxin-antitoxin module
MSFTYRTILISLLSALLPQMVAAQSPPTIDVQQNGDSYLIRVEATLPAPARQVWAALTNCARAREFVPHLESCRIIEKDPAGRWDVRENVANPPLLPRIRTVVRNEYTPTSGFTYRLVSGDMKVSEGSWSVKAAGNSTNVIYAARVQPSIAAPSFLVIGAIKSDLPSMFENLAILSGKLASQTER